MSQLDAKAVHSFAWLDGWTKWGLVAGITALVLIIVIIILVWCMRSGPDDKKDKSEKCKDQYRYGGGPYTGMVVVPINDGISPNLRMGAPPPYSLMAKPENVQPGALANEKFGYSPYIYATPSIDSRTAIHTNGFRSKTNGKRAKTPLNEVHEGRLTPTGGLYNGRLTPPPSTKRPQSPPPNPLQLYFNELSTIEDNYSSYSEEEDEQSSSKVWFAVKHREKENKLEVEILKAIFKQDRDRSRTVSDEAYIRIMLLPDEQNSYRTKSKKKTMTPKFNEKFTFELAAEEARDRVLRLSSYMMDRRNVRNCLGHVLVNLEDVNIEEGDTLVRDLQATAQPSTLGDINYSMNYQPNNEKLKITIIKCRHLKKLKAMPISDFEAPTLFIKAQIICGRKQFDKKMTKGLPANHDPAFNEVMTFNLTQKQMSNTSVILTVMTSQIRGDDMYEEIYGTSTVGPFMFAHGQELQHWKEMLAKPRTSITKWHSLH